MGFLRGKSANDFGSQICEGVELSGDFYFSKRVYIGGVVKGKIRADALLEVGPTGRIEADAEVRRIFVQGEFQGTIHASERVEIHKEGKVRGEIFSPCLIIESGAFFEGHCNMGEIENSTSPDSAKKEASLNEILKLS
jgi:cytoskeletal protein CcmA (bactofilin family)